MKVSIPEGFNTAPVFPKTAFFSVFDSEKPGLEVHAQALLNVGVETIYSSGGTAKYLADHGIPVIDFNVEVTGKPPAMSHRLATLGYESGGAILPRRNDPQHMADFAEYCRGLYPKAKPWDIVAVSIYPFEQTLASGENDLLKLIEKIDIGGPTLLREAAKNCEWVVPIPGMGLMTEIIEELRTGNGIPFSMRAQYAEETFELISSYDDTIRSFFHSVAWP